MGNEAMKLPEDAVLCEVLTRREGVLSAVGHDLRIRATRSSWEVDRAQRRVAATIETASLHVVCAMDHGRDAPEALSDADRQMIDRAMRDDVLEARRFPEIRVQAAFEGTGDSVVVKGRVTLRDVERPFEARASREGNWWSASCVIDQTAFGIRPYTAMLGALKVRREVEVRVRLRIDE
jgi:polyisoprenoid-binding protein YceI